MGTDLAKVQEAAQGALMELVLIDGDLSKLQPKERTSYYLRTCESLGINPFTRPFEYIKLNGKLTLYTTKNCTDQLRYKHKVSVDIVSREKIGEAYVVTARATTPDARRDESTGVVTLTKLTGDALANAMMKAETKAKRRVTLSICGLSFPDESEIDSIKGAQRVSREEAEEAKAITPALLSGNEPPNPKPDAENLSDDAGDTMITLNDWVALKAYAGTLGIPAPNVLRENYRLFDKRPPNTLLKSELAKLRAHLEAEAAKALGEESEKGRDPGDAEMPDAREQAAAEMGQAPQVSA